MQSLNAEVDLDDKTRLRVNYQPDADRFNLRDLHNDMDLNCRYEVDDKCAGDRSRASLSRGQLPAS